MRNSTHWRHLAIKMLPPQCFEQYATGEWSGIDLTLAARAKGLTTRETATKPPGEVGLSTMYQTLQNPYYMGVVSYRGIHYEGKHQALVEPDVWLAVQDVLVAHNHTGEKDRKNKHYLRSTIFCSGCDGRMVYSENTGNGGTYAYFVCVKKKTKTKSCRRPAVRLERIENGIADFYATFNLSAQRTEQIRTVIRAELDAQQAGGSLRRGRPNGSAGIRDEPAHTRDGRGRHRDLGRQDHNHRSRSRP